MIGPPCFMTIEGRLLSVRTVIINILHFLKPINCIYMYHMKTGVFQTYYINDGAVAIIRQSDSPTVRQSDKCFKLMKVLKNNLAKDDIFVISGYGLFIFIHPSKYGLLWHTAVRPSIRIF
jgi:hypothetical protein